MKKRKALIFILMCTLIMTLLSGCGTTFDASGYLNALLDNSYKNDSTAFVQMKIGSAEEATVLYEQGLDAEVAAMGLSSDMGFTEEELAKSREVFAKMLAGVRYTVEDAKLQENQDYVVTVIYEQMNIYAPTMELYLKKMTELYTKWEAQPPTEAEQVKEILMTSITCMDEALALATYDEPATTTVRVELKNNVYYPNEEDLLNLEMILFDMDAMEGSAGTSSAANVYTNEVWNYTVEMPASWEGKYLVIENGNRSTFVQTATYEKYGEGTGCLFQIVCIEGKKTQEEVDATVDGAVPIPIIMQTQEYTYAYVLPSDVQHPIWADADEEDAVIAQEYEDMASDIDEIIASIKVID